MIRLRQAGLLLRTGTSGSSEPGSIKVAEQGQRARGSPCRRARPAPAAGTECRRNGRTVELTVQASPDLRKPLL